jgi:16S rRNA (guanine966-N2)-methyltransferase
MRIIAGRLKGRRLQGPRWPGLRPTSDSLRETLFNILGNRVDGTRVLDAYAGTGALGIEAFSRGAAHVTFIEHDRRATALVARNLAACGIGEGYTMVPVAFEIAAGRLRGERFDLILLDPPYDAIDLDGVLIAAAAMLADDGLVVLEHGARAEPPVRAGALTRRRRVVAGDSALAFYERETT